MSETAKKKRLTDYRTRELAPRKGKRRLYWCGPARLAYFPYAKIKAFTGVSLRKKDGYCGLRWALDMHHDNYLTWDKKRGIKAA